MFFKKISIPLLIFHFFWISAINIQELFAVIPFYNVPYSKNLKKESLSIGKSAYQLLYFGQIKEALNLAKLAISLNANDEKLWAILADAQIANNLNKKALESLERGKQINPFMSELYFAESSIYVGEKNFIKAKKAIEEGLKIQPNTPTAIFQLGNIYLMEFKYNKAINSFNKAIKIKTDFWQAFNNIGLAYFELDKIELSIKYFEKAVELEDNGEPLLGLAASILYKDKKRAIQLTKKALLKDPQYVSKTYRKEQLWGSKIQKITNQLLMLKELEEDIIFAKQYLK
tara:strand:- start:8770 stop:9630 length:861 start_codon:yes stop_codon:yes gene_type:complete